MHISVLVLFTTRPESLSHLGMDSSDFSISGISSWMLLLNLGIKLSSANVIKSSTSNKGDTYLAYSGGPRMDPCTVPSRILCMIEFSPSTHM